jgi:hypothetical protein
MFRIEEGTQMHDLVKSTIDAHGGLERWTKRGQISAAFTASGLGFKQKGPVGQAFTALPMRVTKHTRKPNAVFEPFVASGQRGIYQPHWTIVELSEGSVVEALDNSRNTLRTVALGASWSAPQVLYLRNGRN